MFSTGTFSRGPAWLIGMPRAPPFRETLDWLTNERIDENGIIPIAIQTLRMIWRETPLVHQREGATVALFQTLLKRPSGRELVQGIAGALNRIFPLEPLAVARCRELIRQTLAGATGPPF